MSESWKAIESAQLVATALSGSWRSSVAPPPISSAELAEITPLLIQSGAGALVWWRIRDSALATADTATQLHQAYRLHRLEASLHVRRLKRVLQQFRETGIEPVLVKGWNVARLYPEPGLRHYFDVDLCVASDQHAKAEQLLADLGDDGLYVDLHKELDHLDTIGWDEFFARTQLLRVDDTEIRVPCAEDHLRILCIHWLRHGAWKPAGLCDIAAALESRPVEFNWRRCLGPDPVRADWVACTIGLAQELLGAEVSGKREEDSASRFPLPASLLPRWLVPALLRQWSKSLSPDYRKPALPALLAHVHARDWKELITDICSRLDQPVRATVALRGRFNNWPRWPYQLGELLLRSSEVPKQLALILREGVRHPRSQAAENRLAPATR